MSSWIAGRLWLLNQCVGIGGGVWRIYHDEDIEVVLNGRKLVKLDGFVRDYLEISFDADAAKALRKGRNVLAVQCHQTAGGQNVDVGLTLVGSATPQAK